MINPLASFGIEFRDPSLLDRALTHRSVGRHNYERLEFLGDALVNAGVALLLFRAHPRNSEGELTRLRASLICESGLADIGRELNLSDHLRLGSGELKSGGYRRDSILADAVEALIAAVYLDQGWEACQALIEALFAKRVGLAGMDARKDAKTELQEWLQARALPRPEYTLVHSVGKDHDKLFYVECRLPQLEIKAVATGRSRKSAEQDAAAAALRALQAPKDSNANEQSARV